MPILSLVHRKLVLLTSAAAGLVLLTGCQTYKDSNLTLKHWRAGQLEAAEKTATERLKKNVKRDGVLNQLEHATVLRATGKLEESLASFEVAETRINDYDEAAKTSVSGEVGKTLSNQAQAEYKGRDYDKILLNTYRALNYIALGKREEALNELIRVQQRQTEAEQNNIKRIAKAEQEMEEAKDKDKIKKSENDPKFKAAVESSLADLQNLPPVANYENTFAIFLNGLLFLTTGETGPDIDSAINSFLKLTNYFPSNKYIKADYEAAEALVQRKPLPPTTYVIFETGRAPIRDQIRIDIPTFVGPGYVGAAFPKLELQPDYVPHLTVATAGTSEDTAVVASVDAIIGTAFKNELPTIITKTIISTVTKAVASYAAREAAKQAGGDMAGLFAVIATSAYQAAVNIADTRTWTTLPKEFQYCRVPTPADRKLELKTPVGQSIPVTVQEGTINVVYVRSIGPQVPLIVSQFKLK